MNILNHNLITGFTLLTTSLPSGTLTVRIMRFYVPEKNLYHYPKKTKTTGMAQKSMGTNWHKKQEKYKLLNSNLFTYYLFVFFPTLLTMDKINKVKEIKPGDQPGSLIQHIKLCQLSHTMYYMLCSPYELIWRFFWFTISRPYSFYVYGNQLYI